MEIIEIKGKQYIKCNCGSSYRNNDKAKDRHERTIKHKKYIVVANEVKSFYERERKGEINCDICYCFEPVCM